MNQDKAFELLGKLKPYEKNSESENGLLIHKFFAIPLDVNYKIQNLWNQQSYFSSQEYSLKKFKLVGYHRSGENYLKTEKINNIIMNLNH